MDISFLYETFIALLGGLPLTLRLAFSSVLCGGIFAVFIAFARNSNFLPINWLARFYVFIFRGTPLLVQIFLIYYGLGQYGPALKAIGLWSFFNDQKLCAIFALALNTAAYGSEIIRGALLAVPAGQVEAARASGMSGFLLLRRIVFPIAFRQALPAYGNEIILMVKSTSLASVITVMEITGIAHEIIAKSYNTVQVFIIAGALYLLLNFLITRCIAWLEWKLSPHLRKNTEPLLDPELSNG